MLTATGREGSEVTQSGQGQALASLCPVPLPFLPWSLLHTLPPAPRPRAWQHRGQGSLAAIEEMTTRANGT